MQIRPPLKVILYRMNKQFEFRQFEVSQSPCRAHKGSVILAMAKLVGNMMQASMAYAGPHRVKRCVAMTS